MDWLLKLHPVICSAFAILIWDGVESEFDESHFQFPAVQMQTTTWLAVLIKCHWVGCEITRAGDSIFLTVLGLDAATAYMLASILCRRLDTTMKKMHLFVDLFHQADYACGWALLYRWYERYDRHDSIQVSEEDLEDLPSWRYTLVQDVLAKSIENWQAHEFPPHIWHLAHQLRLDFFCHLGLQDNDAAPVIDYDFILRLPPASSQRPVGSVLHFGQYEALLKDIRNQRIDEMLRYPGWLGSDIADNLLQILRLQCPDIAFTAPARWSSSNRTICTFGGYSDQCQYHPHVFSLVLWDQHWVLCEIQRMADQCLLWISAPSSYGFELHHMTSQLLKMIGIENDKIQVMLLPSEPPLGLCGWVLLHDLFAKCQVPLPAPGAGIRQTIAANPAEERLFEAINQANEIWHTIAPPHVHKFAQDALAWFVHDLLRGRITPAYASGGAVQSTAQASTAPIAMAVDSTVDVLQIRDPWAKRSASSQSKWEDLRMDKDHPFRLEDKTVVPQVHRHQLSEAKGGIVLVTKAQLPELSKIKTSQPLAAIIPAIEHGQLQAFSSLASGPYEIVLHDGALNTSYKRIATLLTFEGKISYSLVATPAFEFKTNAISEIVIELDNRLTAKDAFDKFGVNPLRSFQEAMKELFPKFLDQATFYALRQNRHPSGDKSDFQYQCIVKLPQEHRQKILEGSGQEGFLLRDFLEKNHAMDDVTVLPRFWPASMKGLREILIAGQALPGNAGVSLTKRGLALRVWTEKIKEARRHLLPNDIRLCDENIAVIPKIQVASSGWPAGAAPVDIVKATLKATKLPAIPLRTYRSAGVHVWILCFEAPPGQKQFTVAIDDVLHEILLTEYQPTQLRSAKGSGKGKQGKGGRASKPVPEEKTMPWVAVAPQQDRSRIDALETKFEQLGKQFNTMEQRQTHFESKFDNKFQEITDGLRQLLQASAQRTRDATGDTPPPKQPRQNL